MGRLDAYGAPIGSMLVFLYTEFSGLNSEPRLLSIGLATETGNELYIEFTDGWVEENCSSWVLEHVVPMLGSERLTRLAAVDRILSWLSSFVASPILIGETDWDTALVIELLAAGGGNNDRFQIKELEFSGKAQVEKFNEARQHYFNSEHVSPHHALVDARAFKYAWYRVFGSEMTPSRNY